MATAIIVPVPIVCSLALIGAAFLTLAGCDNPSTPDNSQSPIVAVDVQNHTTQLLRFQGICDGSAVVQLPNNNLLVAYDEDNVLYEFSARGGSILGEYPYGSLPAGGPEFKNSEADIEGAVAVGPHVWWIGSHGNDGRGRAAPVRQQLFTTTVSVDSAGQMHIRAMAERFDLLPTLLKQGKAADLLNQSMLKRKPKKGGINIEGLSVLDNGNLLLGLRSPLIDNRAARVRSASAPDSFNFSVGNAIAAEVDVSPLPPRVTRFYRLDLEDRGIRDLYATETGFVLIAGDVASGGRFSIYRWIPGAQPRKLLDLPAHFNAEALVRVEGHWLVLSDDGKVKRSDESAADGDRQCDSIRRSNPLASRHPSVFFRALLLPEHLLQ